MPSSLFSTGSSRPEMLGSTVPPVMNGLGMRSAIMSGFAADQPSPKRTSSTNLSSVPEISALKLNDLALIIDDHMIKIATENGMSPDLLRQYYVNQCTTVSRPLTFAKQASGELKPGIQLRPAHSHAGVGKSAAPPKAVVSIGQGMLGFSLPGHKPKSHTSRRIGNPGYSCDIEAALNGAISDEDPDLEPTKGSTASSAVVGLLDLDFDFLTHPENSPRRPVGRQARLQKASRSASLGSAEEVLSYATEYARPQDPPQGIRGVQITHVVSRKNHFYIRFTDQNNSYASFSDLNGLNFPKLSNYRHNSLGMPCTVRFGESWRRGRVDKVDSGRGSVIVFLVDSGVIQEYRMPKDAPLLRVLPMEHSIPPLAFRCFLSQAMLKKFGMSFLKEGQGYKMEFSPVSRVMKRSLGVKSWEVIEMKLNQELVSKSQQTLDVDSEVRDTSVDSDKSIPPLPEAKRLQIGEWVQKLDMKVPEVPEEPVSHMVPIETTAQRSSTSVAQETWD